MSQSEETLTASYTEQQSDELKDGTNVSLVICKTLKYWDILETSVPCLTQLSMKSRPLRKT